MDPLLKRAVRGLPAFATAAAPCVSALCLPARCLPARCLPALCLPARCLPARCLPARCLPALCPPALCFSALCLAACASRGTPPPVAASPDPGPAPADAVSRALGDAEPVAAAPTERDVRRPRDPGPGAPRPQGGVSGAGDSLVLRATTDDPTYGYAPANPVRVGGAGAHRYLAGLWGPEGQPLAFERLRSCCLAVAGHSLELYALSWRGLDRPLLLYVDLQEHGPLRIPLGLRGAGAE